jgi:hypothetical protein
VHLLIDAKDPVRQHYQPFKWWLLPHGLAGACALLPGPMQFSDRLRKRLARFHRVAATETVVWVCLGFAILLADAILQWQALHRARPIPAKAHAISQ